MTWIKQPIKCRPTPHRATAGQARWPAGEQRLQRLDRALVDAVPFVGRYCWETVIVLER